MKKINNRNGIDFYWGLSIDANRVIIYDSNKKYFDDLYYETDDNDEDLNSIISTLEETTLQEMCAFFNATLYEEKKELLKELSDYNINDEDDYINKFIVNDKEFYTDAW